MKAQRFEDYDAFADVWATLGYDQIETKQYWSLLELLSSDELLVELPEWLADEKVGYVDGATPTAFVGRIDEETEKAILLVDSAAARPLSRLAHRIQELEGSIERLQSQDETNTRRIDWLRRRLDEKRTQFEAREDIPSLTEEWLPKSQLEFTGQRGR